MSQCASDTSKVRLLLLAALLLCATELFAQTPITIRVLDGKHGTPIAQQRLLFFGGTSEEGARSDETHEGELTTGNDGTVSINLNSATQFLLIYPDFMTRCSAKLQYFRVNDIARTGFVSQNNCSKLPSPQTKPGELILYIRKPTLREKMAW